MCTTLRSILIPTQEISGLQILIAFKRNFKLSNKQNAMTIEQRVARRPRGPKLSLISKNKCGQTDPSKVPVNLQAAHCCKGVQSELQVEILWFTVMHTEHQSMNCFKRKRDYSIIFPMKVR